MPILLQPDVRSAIAQQQFTTTTTAAAAVAGIAVSYAVSTMCPRRRLLLVQPVGCGTISDAVEHQATCCHYLEEQTAAQQQQ